MLLSCVSMNSPNKSKGSLSSSEPEIKLFEIGSVCIGCGLAIVLLLTLLHSPGRQKAIKSEKFTSPLSSESSSLFFPLSLLTLDACGLLLLEPPLLSILLMNCRSLTFPRMKWGCIHSWCRIVLKPHMFNWRVWYAHERIEGVTTESERWCKIIVVTLRN